MPKREYILDIRRERELEEVFDMTHALDISELGKKISGNKFQSLIDMIPAISSHGYGLGQTLYRQGRRQDEPLERRRSVLKKRVYSYDLNGKFKITELAGKKGKSNRALAQDLARAWIMREYPDIFNYRQGPQKEDESTMELISRAITPLTVGIASDWGNKESITNRQAQIRLKKLFLLIAKIGNRKIKTVDEVNGINRIW